MSRAAKKPPIVGPVKATMHMVVLWEDELRAASKALAEFSAAQEPGSAVSENDMDTLLRNAINACFVALHGADVDDARLLLSTKPRPAG